jgi:hypothetical protein
VIIRRSFPSERKEVNAFLNINILENKKMVENQQQADLQPQSYTDSV